MMIVYTHNKAIKVDTSYAGALLVAYGDVMSPRISSHLEANMLFIEIIAILSCTVFAGAAIYVNVVEHPARLECGTEFAATVFGPSYHRAAAMQASLALIATITGVSLGISGGSILWFSGACIIFFVVPFTFIAIMPTNKLLLNPDRERGSGETASLLRKWGKLHAIRSLASSIAAILYVYLGVAT